jgi:hypothetical protein
MKLARYRCQQCGAGRALQVHHRTYDRVGAEWDEDLQVLCADCHRGETIQQMHDIPQARVFLKLAAEVLKEQPYATFADLASDVKDRCAKLGIHADFTAIDKALSVLSASSRVTPPPAQTASELHERTTQGRPISHQEAREFLVRMDFAPLIKSWPAPKGEDPFHMDIYGPIPRDTSWGDHDEY